MGSTVRGVPRAPCGYNFRTRVYASRMPEVSKAFDEYFARLGELVKEPEKYRAYAAAERRGHGSA